MVTAPRGTKRVLITVRTYPVPAWAGVEVSCTAGVTAEGDWIRLFPVPYRFLDEDKRFKKYQWIEVETWKATRDPRPESHHLNIDSIQILPKPVRGWEAKRNLTAPLLSPSMCYLRRERDEKKFPTLGLFKPKEILGLEIEPEEHADWTEGELSRLRQIPMLGPVPRRELQKVPFKWFYRFSCEEAGCQTHRMGCVDWELGASYLKWRARYGNSWEAKFRETYEGKVKELWDTHFYVGTVHGHPNNWIIVGLFYPPKPKGPVLGRLFP